MKTNISALFQKGIYHANQNNYDAAASCFETILMHEPNQIDAIVNSGLMHYYAGRFEKAEQLILSCIAKKPNSADSYYYLGLIYRASNNIHDAMASYQLAINCNPKYDLAWYNLGELFLSQEKYTIALQCFKKVIEISPDFEDAYLNLGESYSRQEQFQKAIRYFNQLLSMNPKNTDALYNLGVAYNSLRQNHEAIAAYDRVILIDPGHIKSHYNKSFCLLLDGDYVNGFSEYEWRLKKNETYRSQSKQPMWQGNPIPSKTLLVYAEQGFGDCIQFIRFLPYIQKRANRIILECQPELIQLFSQFNNVDQIIPRGAPLPYHDFQASLLSMGHLLNITLDHLPSKIPYLKTTTPLSDQMAQYIRDNKKLKIGLVWGGYWKHFKENRYGTFFTS